MLGLGKEMLLSGSVRSTRSVKRGRSNVVGAGAGCHWDLSTGMRPRSGLCGGTLNMPRVPFDTQKSVHLEVRISQSKQHFLHWEPILPPASFRVKMERFEVDPDLSLPQSQKIALRVGLRPRAIVVRWKRTWPSRSHFRSKPLPHVISCCSTSTYDPSLG